MSIKSTFWRSKSCTSFSDWGEGGCILDKIQKISSFFPETFPKCPFKNATLASFGHEKYLDFYHLWYWCMKEVLADILLTLSCYFTWYAVPTQKFEQPMSIVFGFSKEFIASVMRALKYKMFYITLIFIAEKIWAMLFILCTFCIRLMNFVWLVVKM